MLSSGAQPSSVQAPDVALQRLSHAQLFSLAYLKLGLVFTDILSKPVTTLILS